MPTVKTPKVRSHVLAKADIHLKQMKQSQFESPTREIFHNLEKRISYIETFIGDGISCSVEDACKGIH